jgi:hypothetical protein
LRLEFYRHFLYDGVVLSKSVVGPIKLESGKLSTIVDKYVNFCENLP